MRRRLVGAGIVAGLLVSVPLVLSNVGEETNASIRLGWAGALLVLAGAAVLPRWAAASGLAARLWYTGPAVLVAAVATTVPLLAGDGEATFASSPARAVLGAIAIAAFLAAVAAAAAFVGWAAARLTGIERPAAGAA